MNYGEILSRALAISWRHKYLWLLALLAGEGAGVGFTNFQRGNRPSAGRVSLPAANDFSAWVGAHAGLLAGLAIAVVILALVLLVISAVAVGAVIRAAAEHDGDRPYGLGPAWRAGLGSFWPVLGVKLISLAVGLVGLVVIGGLVFATFVAGSNHDVAVAVLTGASAGLLVLVAIPFAIVFGVVVRLALRAVVLDGSRPSAAIGHGFALVRRRLGRVALVWLLALLSGAIGGLVIGIAVVIVALPLAAVTAATYFAGGVPAAIWVGLLLAAVWALIALTLTAALAAFSSTLWTLAYARLDLDPEPAPAAVPSPA